MPKGFGSENMSRIKMFNPTAQVEEIVEFVYDTVYQAGGNPCPPLVIGVGLGGSFDYAAVLAKKALAREVGVHNERYRELEERILRRVNESGVGPSGLGGDTTALWPRSKRIRRISPAFPWPSIFPAMRQDMPKK